MSSYFPIPNNFEISSNKDLSIESSITVFNYPNNSLLRNINKKKDKIYYYVYFLNNDKWLKSLGYKLMTPRDKNKRGGHISIMHENARSISIALRNFENVIVDYREPNQIRIALSPLATSFNELYEGLKKIRYVTENKTFKKVIDFDGKKIY